MRIFHGKEVNCTQQTMIIQQFLVALGLIPVLKFYHLPDFTLDFYTHKHTNWIGLLFYI